MLLKYRNEVFWCVVFREVDWVFSGTHQFIELIAVEVVVVIAPNAFIRGVAIDDISFSMFVVLVVPLGVFYNQV